jgi:hypothetical protein
LGLGLDTNPGTNQQFLNGSFNPNNGGQNFDNDEFISQQQSFSTGNLGETNFSQAQDFDQQFKQEEQQSPFGQQQPQRSFTQELLSANISSNFDGDFALFSAPNNQNEQFDPQLFINELSPQPRNPSVNPAELNMSSPPNNNSTPPGFLQPDTRSPSSTHQSPSFNQGAFQSSPGHSRHASLGPESAAYPQGQNHVEWSHMMPPQFQGHRRTPSEYSDVSVSSAAPSPNLGHHDSFEPLDHHHSPMQNPNDAMYQEIAGIGSFSLSDPQVQHGASPGRGLSPAHSPAISPRLGPQQLPNFNQQNQFILSMNNGFAPPNSIYGAQNPEFQLPQGDMGPQQMTTPQINVEFAPASRTNSFDPPKPSFDQDALTPPDRGMLNLQNTSYGD